MSAEEEKIQIQVETEKLTQLEHEYKMASQAHSSVVESFGKYEGGSTRQENLRDKQISEASDTEYKAKLALDEQQRVVNKLRNY